MRAACWVLAAALAAGVVAPARAAVTARDFPPRTVRDLIAICSAGKDDPMMTAAVNFCHGYVEGAVEVQEAHMARMRGRRLFCIPSPPPSRNEALSAFTAWANADPSRLDR